MGTDGEEKWVLDSVGLGVSGPPGGFTSAPLCKKPPGPFFWGMSPCARLSRQLKGWVIEENKGFLHAPLQQGLRALSRNSHTLSCSALF